MMLVLTRNASLKSPARIRATGASGCSRDVRGRTVLGKFGFVADMRHRVVAGYATALSLVSDVRIKRSAGRDVLGASP
jgi:hypothetical protein